MNQFGYLAGSLILIIIWLLLYFSKKDLRKEMITSSIIFGILGLIIDPILMSDWWKPLTITNTIPGIESFLFGFSISGIASIIYIWTFNKRLKSKKSTDNKFIKNLILFISLGVSLLLIFIYLLKIHSFYSTILSTIILIIIIWIKRKDLIKESIISGGLLILISLPAYLIPEFLFPGWIQASWQMSELSKVLILGIPIEDLIWIFVTGLYIGPLYEFIKKEKIV